MGGRTAAIFALVAALVVGLFIVLLAGSETGRSSSFTTEILGKVAPPIEGPTIQGDTFDIRDHRGRWVVVNFFASWCAACVVEHPELVEFRERHRGDDVEIVAVMFADSEQGATDFFRELGGDWPALVTDTGRIAIDYGVTAVPETLLIAPTGRVAFKWIGASGVTADAMDRTIAELIEAGGG